MKKVIIFLLAMAITAGVFAHSGHGSTNSIVHSVEHGIWYLLGAGLLVILMYVLAKASKK